MHTSINVEAFKQGKQVFLSIAELISLLKTEEYVRKSQLRLNRVRKYDLIIIDTMIFIPIEANEAKVFFELVSDLYEKKLNYFNIE